MFIISLTYVQPMEAVEAALTAHVDFLDRNYADGTFICSGRKNPRTGGIILCKGNNLSEIHRIIEDDPFYQRGIARYEITEFFPTKYAESFGTFVEQQTQP